MWKYNLYKHSVDEQPTMGTPDNRSFWKSSLHKIRDNMVYKQHIESLRSIPVRGKVDWKDGEDVTGKFEIKDKYAYGMNEDVAIPINIQEQPQVLNTDIVAQSFKHEVEAKGNPNKYPVSAFSFRQGAMWLKKINQSQEQPIESEDEDELWQEVENIFSGSHHYEAKTILKKQFTITRRIWVKTEDGLYQPT